MRVLALIALLSLAAPARDLKEVLRSVEQRYNRAATLEVHFEQRYLAQGAGRRTTESGELALRKPGRMRWSYAAPAGKVFVSDGKVLWFYSPEENRAERSRMKDTEDFRAPLAFLLGKLDFSRDFGSFELRETGEDSTIVAMAKSEKLPYTRVEFTVTPQNVIRRLLVQGTDATVMEFHFTNERLNAPVNDAIFRYTPPKGAEIMEAEQ